MERLLQMLDGTRKYGMIIIYTYTTRVEFGLYA